MKKLTLEHGFYGLLLLIALLLGYAAMVSSESAVPLNNEAAGRLEGEWQYQLSNGETGTVVLPARLAAQTNETFTISHRLPAAAFSGETLRIRTSQQSLRIVVDGEEIYTYGQQRLLPFLQGRGSLYHFVRVPESCAGQTMTLELSSVYPRYAGYLNEVAIGTKNALVVEVVRENKGAFICCLLIGLVGFVLISCYIFCRKKWEVTKGALYLGIGAFTIALWTLSECKMIEFLLPNPALVYLLTFISLMLAPLPMLMFLHDAYPDDLSPRVYHTLGRVVIAVIIIELTLQLLGLADFLQMLPLTHIAVSAVAVAFVPVVIKDCRKRGGLSLLGAGVLLLVFCAIIDLLRFYGGGLYNDNALAMRMGMLLFLTLLSGNAIGNMYRVMCRGMEYKALETLAYVDVLTKCGNRAAFEQVMEQLEQEPETYPDVEMMMVDVNDFKHFNDKYGHNVGDQILQAVSAALQSAFAEGAICYRVGGDEFVLIALQGFDRLEARLRYVEQSLKAAAGQYEVAIAYGKSGRGGDQSRDIWAVYREADEKMYACKRHKSGKQNKEMRANGQTDQM